MALVRTLAGGLVVGALALAAGCPQAVAPLAPIPPVSTGKVRVRVFTEPSPVRVLASVGRFVFAGTEHGLERWDATGGVIPLSAEHGLSGSDIVALASDPERRLVWVLTEGGLGHYDAAAEVFREHAAPPASLGLDLAAIAKQGASLAASIEGGVWLGTQGGLFFVSEQGGWTATAITEPIRALARNAAGWLWMATADGLVARRPTGETVRIGPAMGNMIAKPRLVVELPEERLLVIGDDVEGRERLAIGKDTAWTTYRALPDVTWDAAARRGTGAVLLGGGRVYHLAAAVPGKVRPLTRDGLRLVALASVGPPTDWVIDPLDAQPPPGAVSLGASDDQLLIGTRDLGTARYRDGDVRPRDWLRRKQMVRDATTLTVACAAENDCWIATGGDTAWHWDGDGFEAAGPAGQIIVAVVRDPEGDLFAVHRDDLAPALRISRIEGSTWTPIADLAITTPGEAPDVAFARFAGAGTLWLGLRYRDGIEMRAHGVAVVNLEDTTVIYHRTGVNLDPKGPLPLPIPVGVVDAQVRGETAWFATNEGIARLVRGELTLWTEADGLRSEIARAVTIAADGAVIVATGAGAARWTGKAWEFPPALRFDINDVVATRNGQVWMATDRGIAAWDGRKVRRVDTRRGLAENNILEVATDQFDRVWARGAGSLTLISQ